MPHAPPRHRPPGWRPAPPKATDPFYGSTFWKQLRTFVRHRDRGVCALCRTLGAWRVDHIVPRTSGGPDHPANLRLLCESCDNKRHAEKGKVWRD